MNYSLLRSGRRTKSVVSSFGGYNHHARIGAGEFYSMTNLSSRCYPLLAPRVSRGFYVGGSDIRALLPKEQLCYVDGEDLVLGSTHIPLGIQSRRPQLVSMGAYVIVMPDKKYVNTAAPEDRGSMEAFYTSGPFTASLCRADGSEPELLAPAAEPEEGIYRIQDGVLWIYSAARWVQVPLTYLKLTAPGIGTVFSLGDGVEISGDDRLPQSAVIQSQGENFIVIQGFLDQPVSGQALRLSRTVPEMDFVVEAGNRLWGCRYGMNQKGKLVNELYASKLGDFKNWQVFQGISTDSYIASLGSDGPFTGAICYLGSPLFFKEEQLHRVCGTEPASFQVQSDGCRGVQRGSEKSLAIVGETLYYKSRLGICAYDGGLPKSVSEALGEDHYRKAVAGGHGSKYYISMADDQGTYHLFVLDTLRKMWHREDNTQALDFASYDNELYFIDAADRRIKTEGGTGAAPIWGAVEWEAETGLIGLEDPDRKSLHSLQIRIQLWPDSEAEVCVEYDSSGVWQFACALRGVGTGTYTMPVKPRPCDHLRLRLRGKGEMRLLSIARVMGR